VNAAARDARAPATSWSFGGGRPVLRDGDPAQQRGHDVLLLDEARFPRDKVCGEGVSPEAWRLPRPPGRPGRRSKRSGPTPLRGMSLVSPRGTAFHGTYRRADDDVGFAVRRDPPRPGAPVPRPRGGRRGARAYEGHGRPPHGRVGDGRDGAERHGPRALRLRASSVAADGRRSVVARELRPARRAPLAAQVRGARPLGRRPRPAGVGRDARRPGWLLRPSHPWVPKAPTSRSCSTGARWRARAATSRPSTARRSRRAGRRCTSGCSGRRSWPPRARSGRSRSSRAGPGLPAPCWWATPRASTIPSPARA
jgi:hypothetical protein